MPAARHAANLPTKAPNDAYKYRWSRFIAREKLDNDFKLLNERHKAKTNRSLGENINDWAVHSRRVTIGEPPREAGNFKVGIIGAGCAGLFTAMILDHLNEKIPGLNIDYDILDAAGQERLGGRLYTHKFSEAKHDYYDVGAMRFPNNDIMARTFRLFEYIGIDSKLVPYYYKEGTQNCPMYFNDIQRICNEHGGLDKEICDPFNINKGINKDDPNRIPDHLMRQGPETVLDDALDDFIKELKKDIKNKNDKEGWRKTLMKADYQSTRQFLRDQKGYNFNTVEWLETFSVGTGWFNQSLSETVLESLDFDPGKGYWCLEGGAQQVASSMAKMLKGRQPEFHKQVTAIAFDKDSGDTTVTIHDPRYPTGQAETRDYFAIFNSTTLGALQRMDLTNAGLLYGTKQAIRSLGYGASCKVGMKFKTAWWRLPPYNITEGGLGKTDLPLRVCVYPSYNTHDDAEKENVLLCSYSWGQDAQRLGSLISRETPYGEEELKRTLFHDLARLHSNDEATYAETLQKIEDNYITHHSWDWYADRNMNGAFAYFGPGQFSHMWPDLLKPNNWLFLVGEAASAHHAWIVGALESAVRGVFQMLHKLALQAWKRGDEKARQTYRDAIRILKTDEGTPFAPLPLEIPERQKRAHKGDKRDTPGMDPDANEELSFTAAQILLSSLESMVEVAEAEEEYFQLDGSANGSNHDRSKRRKLVS